MSAGVIGTPNVAGALWGSVVTDTDRMETYTGAGKRSTCECTHAPLSDRCTPGFEGGHDLKDKCTQC